MSRTEPSQPLEGDRVCGNCMHSVVVRGRPEIVCLAYLSISQCPEDVACAEFEFKRLREDLKRRSAA